MPAAIYQACPSIWQTSEQTNYQQEFSLGLMDSERKLLVEIDDALQRIEHGLYGICEGTGLPISKARLEAQPWARYSVDYARKMEQGQAGAA